MEVKPERVDKPWIRQVREKGHSNVGEKEMSEDLDSDDFCVLEHFMILESRLY